MQSIDNFLILAQYTDTRFESKGLIQIRKDRDVIAEVEGTAGMMMMGKYLWAGHDASPTASLGDILIAVSSKKDVDEHQT